MATTYTYNPQLDAGANYQAWVAAGRPVTDASGRQLDVRGAVMDPHAWDSTMQGIATQGGAAGQAAYNTALGQAPSSASNFGNPTFTPGPYAPGGGAPAATPTLGSPVAPPPMPGSVGYPALPGTSGGTPGSNVATPPGAGAPGSASPTTLGQLASGNLSIPGGQPSYPLDIGSYLNPMLGYMLKNGMDTINNSAAAAGSLRSGDTLKQLMQYGLGVSGNAFNNAANIAQGQQAFSYGVDNNDRNFFWNAMRDDRDYNLNRLLSEAGLGLQGAYGANANSRTLADIISRNLLLQGQANMGGTIGGNNAITNAISQLLAQGSGNQSMSILQQLLAGLGNG